MSRDLPDLNNGIKATYLLPGFDEYLLGYSDRSAALDPAYAQRICPGGNGVFNPTIVIASGVRRRSLARLQARGNAPSRKVPWSSKWRPSAP